MSSQWRERLIQVGLGLLLVVVSCIFLWKDTIDPILRSNPTLEGVSHAVRLGVRYWAWKQKAEERAKARELEDAKLRELKSDGEGGVGDPAQPLNRRS